MTAILSVHDLTTHFSTDDGVVPAVDGVSFALKKQGALGIVGESGSGKSVACLSIMGLIPSPPGQIIRGEAIFEGRDLLKMSEAEMRKIRGNAISMVFQEPMSALNPVLTIGDQIMEAIILHQKLGRREAKQSAIHMLDLVGIPSPDRRIDDYPHQLSGGMRQRVMIAMALSCNPRLLIADEPTTALDVTIQAQILDLLSNLREELGTAIIMITHDLGVIAETVEQVAVMYTGRIVEYGTVAQLFSNPRHPYTLGLLASVARLDVKERRLKAIPGNVPIPGRYPVGCAFHPRCTQATERCRREKPLSAAVEVGHEVACWLSFPEMGLSKEVL